MKTIKKAKTTYISKPAASPPKSFWLGLVTENDPRSSRRVVTLMVSGLFLITCATSTALLIYTYGAIKRLSGVNIEALKIQADLIKSILYYQFMIIISGLVLITAPQFASVLTASIGSLFRKTTETDATGADTTTKEYIPPPDPSVRQTVVKEEES